MAGLRAPAYTYDYGHDVFGHEIGIRNLSSGWGHYQDEIAGRKIYLSSSATRWLFHPNELGSSTMVTNETGTVVQDATYYPWGQVWQDVDNIGLGNWNFAAFGVLEPTTNLYPTPFRRYSSTQGRWLSPDPAGLAAANPANPQSWNRYGYVMNSPTNLVDPLGLESSGNPCNPNLFHGIPAGCYDGPSGGSGSGGSAPCSLLRVGFGGGLHPEAPCPPPTGGGGGSSTQAAAALKAAAITRHQQCQLQAAQQTGPIKPDAVDTVLSIATALIFTAATDGVGSPVILKFAAGTGFTMGATALSKQALRIELTNSCMVVNGDLPFQAITGPP